ncbi:putative dimethylallyl tryptophan synthase protein [Botrytis cinerea BcDW1]|uniref:Putative dimethylallyl tryptophan synthase protein n=1 Tax=Botryotinia fuckeliana (strain BcDW1) TaxID=1290391 RepID=M7TB92_BOTF1|nr:putative dimethylallyl tryptophan synthase protein [Botrytis cinerea BcDW1]
MASFSKLQNDMPDETSIEENINGLAIDKLAVPDSELASAVWESTSKWLPRRNDDCDFWWQSTGPQLGALLFHAGYSVAQQYEGLLFHYHVLVPRLGPRPTSSSLAGGSPYKWKSFMQDDFKPIEYSWKWDTGKLLSNGNMSKPDLRLVIEAIGPLTGTTQDPLNQVATGEILRELDSVNPKVDLTWFHQVSRAIFGDVDVTEAKDHIQAADLADVGSSSMFLAFQFLKGDPKSDSPIKAYFMPPGWAKSRGTDNRAHEKIIAAIRSLGHKDKHEWTTLDQLLSFFNDNENGRQLSTPFIVSTDCMISSECRLKIYVRTPRASFDSVVDILSMGGKRAGFEKNFQELKDLWRLTFDLPIGFSTSEDLPLREHGTSGMCYHFEIHQANALPDVKLYIPTKHYGQSDMKVAKGLTKYLELYGRGTYAADYMKALKQLAPLHQLETSSGVQSYISCALEKESLSLTTYFNPCIPLEIRDLLLVN